jgi:hypothetical protein
MKTGQIKTFLRETVDGQVFHYERWRGDFFHWYYHLLEAHSFRSKLAIPGLFHNSLLLIVPIKDIDGKIIGAQITVSKTARWNGATMAPDFQQVVRGTLFHDIIYDCLEEIAVAWNWSLPQVRRWGDQLFNEVNRVEGFFFPLKLIYYRAVRRLGGLARKIGDLFR